LTEEDYLRAVEILNLLMDDVRDNAGHPLFSLMGIVGELIEAYEAGLTPGHLQLNA
jgi:HTH-type transcriptional regulator / antitoxin HigA